MSSAAPLIELKNVTRILHEEEIEVTLVQDISLTVRAGEFVSVTGPSGSGKSSLLYLMGLLDRPTEGEIFVESRATSGLSKSQFSRLRLEKLGFVFQFHFLLPEFTVLDNVMIPMRRLGKLGKKDMHARAEELLETLGLADHIHKHPSQVSGGQRQRIAIARALANAPAVILADEPTGNLDSQNSRNVHDIFKKIASDGLASVVMVTHDKELAADTDRNIHMVDGKIV